MSEVHLSEVSGKTVMSEPSGAVYVHVGAGEGRHQIYHVGGRVGGHFLPRNPRGKIFPHQSAVFNTSDVGYLGPTSGKKLRKRGQIRAIHGMGPNLRYRTSEL